MTLRTRIADESGIALIMVMVISVVLTTISAALVTTLVEGVTTSSNAVVRQQAYQAAEAGIDAYESKLLEDNAYYLHYVAAGESTRQTSGGTLVTAGNAWTGGTTWTYPNGHDWPATAQLANGYEYNLQVAPPDQTGAISITSTGRKHGDTNTHNWRKLQVLVRPSSVADYYRMVNGDVSFGSTTTTNGQVYANGDISHAGTASANLYAEGQVSGSTTFTNGARAYDSDSTPTIRTPIPVKINFSGFLASLTSIQAAASSGGVTLNSAAPAWVVVFQSNGTFTAKSCTPSSGADPAAATMTNCSSTTTYNVPTNGAVYSNQTIVVSGTVVGRVTVASNNNIDIAANISYGTPGQDVLGLVAANNVVIAAYAPSDLVWSAAVIAESGTWKTYETGTKSHNSMTFTGSSTTQDGGDMTMFNTRTYSYDANLHKLPPPWFPIIDDSYTTVMFRELPPS